LRQLETEAVARDVTQQVIKELVPGQALVSQQTEVGRDSIAVRLVATTVVPDAKRLQAEREIQARSGRAANLTIDTVASQRELAQLVTRLNSQQTAVTPTVAVTTPPAPKPLSETGDALRARVQSALTAVWPDGVTMVGFDVGLTDAGPVVTVKYQAKRAIGSLALQLMQSALREKLGSPKVVLQVTRAAEGRRRR
jgi:hypothetical protein